MATEAEVIDQYIEAMLDHEMKFWEETDPERFKRITPEMIEAFRERQRSIALEFAEGIRSRPDTFMRKISTGLLHPSNGNSRRLFEGLTGQVLPAGANATVDFVFQFFHPELSAYLAKAQAERVAKENERQQKAADAEKARLDKARASVLQGEWVLSEELIDLARSVGVDPHPRTVGSLRKRVRFMRMNADNSVEIRFVGRAAVSDACVAVLRETHAKVKP